MNGRSGSAKRLAPVLLAFALVACGRPAVYQRLDAGKNTGYEDQSISKDTFRIRATGQGSTSISSLLDMALLRAADITLQNDGKYFDVIEGHGLMDPSRSFASVDRILERAAHQRGVSLPNALRPVTASLDVTQTWPMPFAALPTRMIAIPGTSLRNYTATISPAVQNRLNMITFNTVLAQQQAAPRIEPIAEVVIKIMAARPTDTTKVYDARAVQDLIAPIFEGKQ